jgi:GWxTD domain-containing protein
MYACYFDLTVEVTDAGGNKVYNVVSKEHLTTRETGSEYLLQNSQILAKNLFLLPGKFKMKLTIYENSTKRYSNAEKEITVRDFLKEPFSISDVMVVSKLTEINGKKYITPSVSKNLGALDTFNLFFFVYKNNTDKLIDIKCQIFDPEKKEIFSTTTNIGEQAGAFQNQVVIPVPATNFNYGKYSINVTASNPDYTVSQGSDFFIGNAEFPYSLKEIDNLIDQLQYIAKDKEMDYMRDGKTDTEKEKRFLEFWKSKDPSPNTKRNEAMLDYYKRLFYANKHFGTTYTDGWRTDMGMVFVIFGAPSNVDRHPYDMDTKPYEVWDYYDINKQFVFVDNSGFGDYRLITPIWDTYRFQR